MGQVIDISTQKVSGGGSSVPNLVARALNINLKDIASSTLEWLGSFSAANTSNHRISWKLAFNDTYDGDGVGAYATTTFTAGAGSPGTGQKIVIALDGVPVTSFISGNYMGSVSAFYADIKIAMELVGYEWNNTGFDTIFVTGPAQDDALNGKVMTIYSCATTTLSFNGNFPETGASEFAISRLDNDIEYQEGPVDYADLNAFMDQMLAAYEGLGYTVTDNRPGTDTFSMIAPAPAGTSINGKVLKLQDENDNPSGSHYLAGNVASDPFANATVFLTAPAFSGGKAEIDPADFKITLDDEEIVPYIGAMIDGVAALVYGENQFPTPLKMPGEQVMLTTGDFKAVVTAGTRNDFRVNIFITADKVG